MAAHPGQPREVPQLVERAEDLGEGAGDRSGRLARLLDGEFPLDAACRRSRSRRQQKPMIDLERMRLMNAEGGARLSRRRQFRRLLRALATRRCCASGTSPSRRPAPDRRRLGMSGAPNPGLGRRRHRRHGRRLSRARAGHACSSSTAPPSMSRRSSRDGLAITGPIVEFRVKAPGRDAGRAQGPLRTHAAVREGAGHAGGGRADQAASGRRRLRRLAAERAQRAGHRRRVGDAADRSAASSISAPTTWSRASCITAAAARSWSARSTARSRRAPRSCTRCCCSSTTAPS